MARFRSRNAAVEAITFDELVAYGQNAEPADAAAHGGVAWHFSYRGTAVTHENDDCYLIGGSGMRFERGDMLVTGAAGQVYPCKADAFAATYEPA